MSATLDDWLDADTLRESPVRPEFVQAEPPPVAAPPASRPPNYVNWLIAAALVVLVLLQFRSCDGRIIPGPGPNPDDGTTFAVSTPGNFALMLIDKTEEGQARLTDGQKVAINSTKVKTFCDGNGVTLRIWDKANPPTKAEPVWMELINKAGPVPSLTVASDRRGRTGDLPDGPDNNIAAIRSMIQ